MRVGGGAALWASGRRYGGTVATDGRRDSGLIAAEFVVEALQPNR